MFLPPYGDLSGSLKGYLSQGLSKDIRQVVLGCHRLHFDGAVLNLAAEPVILHSQRLGSRGHRWWIRGCK